ncbi:MAG: DUF1579 domain-containing protein [Phycisphaeraceae bacterium]|nr:DUF1579 domain-containing protein [Phycisphaeraceae bacterium]
MKRNSNWIVLCAGLCLAGAPFAMAEPQPQNPAQQTMDQTKDATKRTWQDAKDAAKDGQKQAADMMQGMDPKQMEQMMQSMQPGEHHKLLQQFVGDWDVKSKMWMMPGAPAQDSTGTASTKSDFGGRFVFMTYKSDFMGQPFEGRLTMGYNNNTKQHEGVWIDNMSTGVWFSTGNSSSDGKVFTMTGTFVEPDGQKKATREVTTFQSPDVYVSEFFETGADGKENKMMELTYTRKGGAAPTVKPAGTSGEPSK